MPKRSHEESKEERWSRKMKKYEEKLKSKRCDKARRIINSDEEADVQTQEHLEHVEYDVGLSTDEVYPRDSDNLVGCKEPMNEVDVGAGYRESTSGLNLIDESAHIEENYDPQMLAALGEVEPDPVEFGEDLQEDIATRYQKILLSGLQKEIKDEILKKYRIPRNLLVAKAPTLNPEISAMLAEVCKARDKRLLVKQDQLGKALTALSNAMTGLLKKSPDIPEALRILNDAGKILADSHFAETDTRRSVIIPLVDKSLIDPFKDRKRDTFLFGENLGDLVKNSRGIKKTGQMIQAPSPINLNGRGPSSRVRYQQRGSQPFTHRSGGPRQTISYNSRRRALPPPPPPPPPTARRYPPIPAAPAPPPIRRPPPRPTQMQRYPPNRV